MELVTSGLKEMPEVLTPKAIYALSFHEHDKIQNKYFTIQVVNVRVRGQGIGSVPGSGQGAGSGQAQAADENMFKSSGGSPSGGLSAGGPSRHYHSAIFSNNSL